MTRMVARENSQAAEDKDPKAVRPDRVGKRRLDEKTVEDRVDPAIAIERGRAMNDYFGSFEDDG